MPWLTLLEDIDRALRAAVSSRIRTQHRVFGKSRLPDPRTFNGAREANVAGWPTAAIALAVPERPECDPKVAPVGPATGTRCGQNRLIARAGKAAGLPFQHPTHYALYGAFRRCLGWLRRAEMGSAGASATRRSAEPRGTQPASTGRPLTHEKVLLDRSVIMTLSFADRCSHTTGNGGPKKNDPTLDASFRCHGATVRLACRATGRDGRHRAHHRSELGAWA